MDFLDGNMIMIFIVECWNLNYEFNGWSFGIYYLIVYLFIRVMFLIWGFSGVCKFEEICVLNL